LNNSKVFIAFRDEIAIGNEVFSFYFYQNSFFI
jgi:hypothetical protein